jgi:8-oxo-dGTP diphosphatase
LANQHPLATVDVALFSLRDSALCVLLGRREKAPFAGTLALPGGFVRTAQDQDTEATARRVIREKTPATVLHLEQLYTFSGRARDPRGWSISVAYYALLPENDLGLEDDERTCLAPVASLPALPFDHTSIVETAVRRLRDKASYSSLPTYLLPTEFTLAELQRVYEQVMDTELDRTTFRRNLLALGVIEPVDGVVRGGAHRPAQVYRRVHAKLQAFDRTL